MAISAHSEEILYPSGSNIQCFYSVSNTQISIADTLKIHRIIVNNENFSLENLYFSENIPSELDFVDYNVSINGIAINYFVSGPLSNYVINGFETYYWVIDSPIASESTNNILYPGDSIELEIKIISNSPGIFILPLHSTVFIGNGSGFFSTSSELEIEFLLSVDVGDDKDDTNKQLPDYLIARAYPNPFNSAIKIWYSGISHTNQQISLTIFDILGKKIYSKKYYADRYQGEIVWKPNNNTGSGVYFYRLSSGTENHNGKLIFLK